MPTKKDKKGERPAGKPGLSPKGEKRHRKSKKLADNSNKASSKSTVIIVNEKPKRKRRSTNKKTTSNQETRILQPIHIYQPYTFNPYEFQHQAPHKVMEVNRQAALDIFDQNRSEEAKSALASLGISPPGVPPLEPRSLEPLEPRSLEPLQPRSFEPQSHEPRPTVTEHPGSVKKLRLTLRGD